MWGKLIDDLGTPQDSYNQSAERARGQEDARHRGTLSLVEQLPFGHGRRFLSDASPAVDFLLGGWGLSVITRANTGYPFSVRISTDNSGTGNNRDRPNQVGNPGLGKNATPVAFWDRNAFAAAPKGQFGNAGRNTLTGPSLWTLDFAALKAFRPVENQQIQFRFEVFNSLNHPNFDDPATTWNTASFSAISRAFDARQIQLGAKWIF